jgi:hypothetical protein
VAVNVTFVPVQIVVVVADMETAGVTPDVTVATHGVRELMQSGGFISQLKNEPYLVVLLQPVILISPARVYGNVPGVLLL